MRLYILSSVSKFQDHRRSVMIFFGGAIAFFFCGINDAAETACESLCIRAIMIQVQNIILYSTNITIEKYKGTKY